MTNLYSILKNRGITLPSKVRLVKAMVFPVVMYGCESWTIKKAERQRIEGLWQPVSSKSTDAVFPTTFTHFISLCHILVTLVIFQTFSLLFYL